MQKSILRSLSKIFLERTQELVLLCGGLIGAVSELRRRIDPLQLDFLQCLSGRVYEHRFAKSHDTLLDTRYGTLKKYKVVLNLPVANKTAHAIEILVESCELDKRH